MTRPRICRRWTADEDAVILAHGDYQTILRHLPHRSYSAVRARAQQLGTRPNRRAWSAAEVTRLRELRCRGLTKKEVVDLFPGRTRQEIVSQAARQKLLWGHPRPVEVADPLMNEVRQRAFDRVISLTELGRRTGAGRYFETPPPHPAQLKHIAAAVAVLGGELLIEWEPLRDD